MCKKIEISKDMVFAKENTESAFKLFDSNSRTTWVGGQFPPQKNVLPFAYRARLPEKRHLRFLGFQKRGQRELQRGTHPEQRKKPRRPL